MIWQLCTLEQAIQLKELGVVQTSAFYWNKAKDGPHKESISFYWTSDAIASAFTVAELAVLFGDIVTGGRPENAASDLAGLLIADILSGIESVEDINKRLEALNQ